MKRFFQFAISIPVFALMLSSLHATAHGDKNPIRDGFVENQGQVKTPAGELHSGLDFLWATGNGVNVQLRNNGLSYDFIFPGDQSSENMSHRYHRLDLKFVNANSRAIIDGKNPIDGHVNIYDGKRKSHTGLPVYQNIHVSEIYPGVDWLVTATEEKALKYDFVVENQTALENIQMRFEGFDSFRLSENKLHFELSERSITEEIPASWMTQSGKAVNVEYHIISREDHSVTIGVQTTEAVNFHSEGELLIDPIAVFQWGSFYSGNGGDRINDVATDSLGNVFFTGTTSSLDMIASSGSYQGSFGQGETDAFVVKFNQHGLRHWATYYGGSGNDEGVKIDVDNYYNVFVVGNTTSQDSIGSELSSQAVNAGGQDGFLARFNRLGELYWDTFIGGEGDDFLTSCRADTLGYVYVSGYTATPGFIEAGGVSPLQPSNEDVESFLLKYTYSDSLVWATYFGGEGDDYILDVELDSVRNIVGVGYTNSTSGIAGINALQPELAGGTDGFVFSIDSSDVTNFSTYLGGAGNDTAKAITSVNYTLFIAGYTEGTNLTDTLSSQPELGGAGDGFVLAMDFYGWPEWFTYLGGAMPDQVNDITRDYAGYIYTIGTTQSDTAFGTEQTHLSALQGDVDAFIAKFNVYGDQIWSTYHGGVERDLGLGIAVHGYTSVYVVGETLSGSVMAKDGPYEDAHQPQPELLTGPHGFVGRFNQSTSTPPIGICNACDDDGNYGGGGSGGGGSDDDGPSGPNLTGICKGDSIKLQVQGGALGEGAQWVWYENSCGTTDDYIADGQSVWVSPDTTTTYYVRFEHVDYICPCSKKTIYVDTIPTAEATALDSVCVGDSLQLFGDGAYSYNWSGPNDFVSAEQNPVLDSITTANEGIYEVVATTYFGCRDTAEVEVGFLPQPEFTTASTPVSCFNGSDGTMSISSSDTSIVSVFWEEFFEDTTAISAIPAGTYAVIVSNAFGCSASDSVTVTEPEPLIDSLAVTDAYCDRPNGGAEVFLTGGSPPYSVEWSNGESNTNSISDILPGNYSVTVTDSDSCSFSQNFNVQNLGQFTAVIEPDTISLDWGEAGQLEVYTVPEPENLNFAWSPEEFLGCSSCAETSVQLTQPMYISVFVQSAQGCTSQDSVYIDQELPPPNTFVPNMFSPNGDGLNDELCLLGQRIVSFQLKIFDTNGNAIFESQNEENCWSGNHNGNPVSGNFVYTLSAILEEGKTVNETGNIQIVR